MKQRVPDNKAIFKNSFKLDPRHLTMGLEAYKAFWQSTIDNQKLGLTMRRQYLEERCDFIDDLIAHREERIIMPYNLKAYEPTIMRNLMAELKMNVDLLNHMTIERLKRQKALAPPKSATP